MPPEPSGPVRPRFGGGVALGTSVGGGGAQTAVDRLPDAKFPVQQTSIVGRDLRLVETVTGRLDYRRAALSGLASGAWFGLLAGAVFSLAAYSATGGRRDFISTSALVAGGPVGGGTVGGTP